MAKHQRFHFRSLESLQEAVRSLGVDLPFSERFELFRAPLAVAGKPLANRFAVHPMEGFDATPDGTPGELSFRRYRRYAAGGSALVWFEATAVVPEGRSNPGQFWIHERNAGTFRRLAAETRAAARAAGGQEPLLVLQLTHSGRYSKPTGLPAPIIAHHSPVLDPVNGIDPALPLVSDDYLDALQEQFVAAARLAAEAGFDGVDIKCCHRYLLSELLASYTRPGRYGGSFENRTRLLRETVDRVRASVPGLFVTLRLNLYDAISYPYGWGVSRDDLRVPDLTEPLELVRQLRAGGLPLLNVTLGNPYYHPHYNRPFDFPIRNGSVPEEHPLEGVARMIQAARRVQEAHPELPVIGTGYTWLRQFMPAVAAGVLARGWASLIGQGRGAFAYPDSVRDLLEKGALDPAKCCVSCSACTQIMRDGGRTGCVVRDSAVYGPEYRLARRFAIDRLLEEARRCRDCEQATCTRGCPACIDIPTFLRAFADGRIGAAYDILREKNLLPEMCGKVCPAAEQCQGHCLENVFCENPVPIQDIQLVVARLARLKGLTGVRLPAQASGQQVAVVGGGPAGLACAIRLLEAGHEVVLYDRGAELGGTPDSMIPEARFADSRAEVEAILAPARTAGRLTLRLGQGLGPKLTVRALRKRHAAVFLGLGLGGSTSLGAGEGVVSALSFLTAAKAGKVKMVPARVAVLGGGNTAMDAGLTALRLGARDCYIVYRRSFAELPAWPRERNEFLAAGGHLLILTQPLGYERDAQGALRGVRICRTELGEPDASGRRRPVPVPDSESVLRVELAVEAIGQTLDDDVRAALDGVGLTPAGLVAVAPGGAATSCQGVFAAGDLVNGGETAVRAIAEGMAAAAEIDAFLR